MPCNLATKFTKLLICTVFVLLVCSYFFIFVTVIMSLNVKYTDTKPCSKPYQLTLNDCLACSSCLTQGESGSLHAFDTSKINDFEKISITPHAKINLANKFNADVHIFAKALNNFFDNKIIDTSHYYKYITSHDDKIITSECPGVVKYIQRMGHHLIDNLMKIKSTQQIIDVKFRCLHIVTCLDKRLENDGNCITTREMYKYLLDNDFEKLLFDAKSIDKQNDVHKTLQVDLKYIESICNDGVITNIVNDNWIEYRDGDKLYAKISGLPNFINFVNQSKKGMKYNVVEAYICTGGCINGPAQIEGLLNDDKAIKDKFEENLIEEKIDDNSLRRTFVKEQAKAKTYKVDW